MVAAVAAFHSPRRLKGDNLYSMLQDLLNRIIIREGCTKDQGGGLLSGKRSDRSISRAAFGTTPQKLLTSTAQPDSRHDATNYSAQYRLQEFWSASTESQ